MNKLQLNIEVRDRKGKSYINSDFKKINPFRQEILDTTYERVKKTILKVYEDYNSISKEGSIITINAYDEQTMQDRLVYSYSGEDKQFKIH